MKLSILMPFTLTLVACASQPPNPAEHATLLAAPNTAIADAVVADAVVADAAAAEPELVPADSLQIEDFQNDRVCEKRNRPGSNIVQTVCYSRDARLAQQETLDKARRDQLDELEREARWRDEIIRQSQLEGRRPSGFGIGP